MKKPVKHRNPLRWYDVLSPVYDYMEPILDGMGPVSEVQDWLGVQAYTKSEAVSTAVRHWLFHRAGYLDTAENPYKSVTAELMSEFPTESEEISEEFYLRRSP